MYVRHPRLEVDEWADTVLHAAMRTSAPKFHDRTGQHLAVVYLSGPQLEEFSDQLSFDSRMNTSFAEKRETEALLEELARCSNFFVISTNLVLILVSNRSPNEYRKHHELYAEAVPAFDAASDAAALFIKGL